MGKKKVIIDNNNLIAALGWDGHSRKLLIKAINEEIIWKISFKQIKELERVMDYPKFKFNKEEKSQFLESIFATADIIKIRSKIDIIKEDKDDNIFLESALDTNADFIISGYKHLLKLKEFNGIKIMKVKDFLDLISER